MRVPERLAIRGHSLAQLPLLDLCGVLIANSEFYIRVLFTTDHSPFTSTRVRRNNRWYKIPGPG